MKSREAALKDDFNFESTSYGYDDEDDDWGEDEASWNAEDETEGGSGADVKDESTAYLEFLNEEVSSLSIPVAAVHCPVSKWLTLFVHRHRSSGATKGSISPTRSLERTRCSWSHRWTSWNPTLYSALA